MHRYILSIDQSTSASKAVLFSDKAEVVDKLSKEHKQFYPRPGWVEHNPEEIFQNIIEIIEEIINRNPGKTVTALSLTNQRETVVVWDRNTGKPVYNAVVWQCNRGTPRCKKLIEEGWGEVVRKKTGLIIDPYFSATGISWILDNVPDARNKAENGELLFGTIDSWLIWNLTWGKVHATDYKNACRTMLFDINALKWDEEIMAELGIPQNMAPEVKYADELFGTTDANGAFSENLPVTGVMGDSHAALFGQLCFEPGMGIEIGSGLLDHDGNIDKSVIYEPVLEPEEIREINIVISFPEGDEFISLRKKIENVIAGRK